LEFTLVLLLGVLVLEQRLLSKRLFAEHGLVV
jgi:hypothetical protein